MTRPESPRIVDRDCAASRAVAREHRMVARGIAHAVESDGIAGGEAGDRPREVRAALDVQSDAAAGGSQLQDRLVIEVDTSEALERRRPSQICRSQGRAAVS